MQCLKPIWLRDMFVPCGKCTLCRKARANEWAIRLSHEFQNTHKGIFVTLTYNDDHLPLNQSVDKKEFIRFIKRVRKGLNVAIKYYACGEYGGRFGRPHYHALLFGIDLKYKDYIIKNWSKDGKPIGLVDVGLIEPASIRYVTNYVLKKSICPRDRERPFQLQSQGLGLNYANANKEQILQEISVQVGSRECGVPRYYQKKYTEQGILTMEMKFKKSKEIQKEILEKIIFLKPELSDEEIHKEVVKARYQREKNFKAKDKMKEEKF